MPITEACDLELLRRSIGLAEKSRSDGNHPFGAVLADADGAILLEAIILLVHKEIEPGTLNET